MEEAESETKDRIKCSRTETQNKDKVRGRKGERRANKGKKVMGFNLLPMLRSRFGTEQEEV